MTGGLRVAILYVICSMSLRIYHRWEEDIMVCKQCGKELAPDDVFCGSCGWRVESEDLGTAGDGEKRFCINCGRILRADAQFCPNCGRPVDGGNEGEQEMACGYDWGNASGGGVPKKKARQAGILKVKKLGRHGKDRDESPEEDVRAEPGIVPVPDEGDRKSVV